MRMRLVLIFIFINCLIIRQISTKESEEQSFIIFSNDGKFYKLDPDEQHVYWHSDLGSKLIQFQIQQMQNNQQNKISTYFIPTIEGHFVYIERNKEILVHRQQIQPLIKMCLNQFSLNGKLSDNLKQQYFLHEKYQYYFLDLNNGKIWNLQKFFQQKIVVKQSRHALIKISKKFLKQLSSNLKVKWSAISSTIDIIEAVDFLKNPKIIIQSKNVLQENYEFNKISNQEIQIKNLHKFTYFQIGGKSPILAVFHINKNSNTYQRYPIKLYGNSLPALEQNTNKKKQKNKYIMQKNSLQIFPQFNQYKNSNELLKQYKRGSQSDNQFDFEYCLNTYRAFQRLGAISGESSNLPFNINKIQQNQRIKLNQTFLPRLQVFQYVSNPYINLQPERSKDQPLIWIFIFISLIIIGIIFYRLKVNKLLNQLEKMETINDKKFQEIQKKLGKFQEMQKMYEVCWDKLLYRKNRRKCSDDFFQPNLQDSQNKFKVNHQIQIYQYLIFQGRFLNKQALVYAVPIQSIDLIHVQHQLNDLLSCSHKSLIKLYYYTKNTQFLLIFCEKIQPYWNSMDHSGFYKNQNQFQMKTSSFYKNQIPMKTQKKAEKIQDNTDIIIENFQSKIVQNNKIKYKQKKLENINDQNKQQNLIKQIIQCIEYLDSHLQIFSLPLEGVILNNRNHINSQKQINLSVDSIIQLKINSIPSILQVYKYDQDSQQDLLKARHNQSKKLRHDLVRIFYFIVTRGQIINYKEISDNSLSKQTVQDEFFVKDFYDFVLNQNYNFNIQILNNQDEQKKQIGPIRKIASHNSLLKQLLFHPYLWDSKRKMLFLSDFSNYLETYLDDIKIKKLETYAKDYQIIDNPWTKNLDSQFVKEVNGFRKYDFNSIKDLIRLIRNKVNHFHEIPKQIRNSVGKTPQAFIQYMLSLYPKLLSFAFVYAKRKKWKLHVQIK